jgi:UDP-N-acetylglucosamine enolpyruvyl transferase
MELNVPLLSQIHQPPQVCEEMKKGKKLNEERKKSRKGNRFKLKPKSSVGRTFIIIIFENFNLSTEFLNTVKQPEIVDLNTLIWYTCLPRNTFYKLSL